MEFFKIRRTIPFLRHALIFNVISAATFLAAVFFLAYSGLNFSVGFTGGTLIEVGYQRSADVEHIRQTLDGAGFKAEVQNFGSSREVLIRMHLEKNQSSADLSRKVIEILKQEDSAAELRRVEFVGPQVGSELANLGSVALLVTAVLIVLYLWMRFEWRFGLSAIVANLHDVVIILGCFAFFQWEFSLPVLAAVLAVLGYSVNESVVVFDRVRENFRKMRKASTVEVIDSAITGVISRTIITHLCTQMMATTMLLFGGPALHYFALALTIGICFGIYSSGLVAHHRCVDPVLARDPGHHRDQVEEAVGDMERDDAVRRDMAQIHAERLARDQVYRDRVAREGIDRQHVEALRRLALHGEPRVAQGNFDARRAVGEKAELALCQRDHVRIDVVEPVDVPLAAVRRDGPGAQPDHADAERPVLRGQDRGADSRARLVIGGDQPAPPVVLVLLAVHDRAVHQATKVAFLARGAVLLHSKDPVEAARGDAHVALEAQAVVGRAARDPEQHGEARNPRRTANAGEAHGGEQRENHQSYAELVVAVEGEGRDHRDQQAAQRAARGHRKVASRTMPQRRTQAVQLAVTEQAAQEQPRQVDAELHRQVEVEVGIDQQPGHGAEPQQQQPPQPLGPVPAASFEGEDEAQQVERKRRQPKQRHRCDVLRQVVGDREQQHRSGRRERQPEKVRRFRRSALFVFSLEG